LPQNDTYPEHVVTAVIVAHDGAAWLPRLVDALLGQTRPVQRVVAVDTGSRDRSGSLLASLLSPSVVFGMDRDTSYGAAVTRALQHPAANAPLPGSSGLGEGDRQEWLWLLHDDSEPAPDALSELLRGATETRSAVVLGPKIMDWEHRNVILEAGFTADTAGRRITGTEPREVDQGQHDGDRDVLAVCSAGMLIRRDVFAHTGGLGPSLGLFSDDTDLCWRVHAAGGRVRVITGAVLYHAEASARGSRDISVDRRPRRLRRRNGLLALLGNLPAGRMLRCLAGNTVLSLARVLVYLLAKRPGAARDEAAALASVLLQPGRLLAFRRARRRGRRAAFAAVSAHLAAGRSARRVAEQLAAALARPARAEPQRSPLATEDPEADDSLLVDSGLLQRILTSPGVLVFLVLVVVAAVAERRLFGGGPLGGGALVPPRGGASALWSEYLAGFHPSGMGSTSTAPPYLAEVAALATVLGGKLWLAVDVILLGSVPLAGVSALLAARRVAASAAVRVWAAASYALLPVGMGAVAAGRIGTAAVLVLLPLIAVAAGRIFTETPRMARRAAWATGLLLALAAAFVPLVWGIALLAALAAAASLGGSRRSLPANLGIALAVPPLLLMPWTLRAAAQPAQLLLEAGLARPGLASPDLPARSLLLLSPGGPGLPPVLCTAGLAVVALAALLTVRRRALVMAGWATALLGLLIAIAMSRVSIRPAGGGPPVTPWPGPPLAVAAFGLLLAAAAAADALLRSAALRGEPAVAGRAARARPGPGTPGLDAGRRAAIVVLGAVACSAPLFAAASWLVTGVRGPVAPSSGQVVPVLVSESARGLQQRTLVLRAGRGGVDFAVLRGLSPAFGDSGLQPVPAAQKALSAAVAALIAPGGSQAADQGTMLARLDIGYVLIRAPVSASLAGTLDGVPGLQRISTTASWDLWRLTEPTAQVQVAEPDGTVVPVRSGPSGVSGARAPAAGGILELAVPAEGWTATLNGRPLRPVASPAGRWAQAFRLPPGGGSLSIGRSDALHNLALIAEGLLLLVVTALALPGTRVAAEYERAGRAGGGPDRPPAAGTARQPALAAAGPAGRVSAQARPEPAGRTSRRPDRQRPDRQRSGRRFLARNRGARAGERAARERVTSHVRHRHAGGGGQPSAAAAPPTRDPGQPGAPASGWPRGETGWPGAETGWPAVRPPAQPARPAPAPARERNEPPSGYPWPDPGGGPEMLEPLPPAAGPPRAAVPRGEAETSRWEVPPGEAGTARWTDSGTESW
jgi:GT2 family glycosyltransferase